MHRRIQEHWFFEDPAVFRVWMAMLFRANWKDSETNIGGQIIHLRRGQLVFGLNAWSAKYGVSVRCLRTTIKNLQDSKMIDKQNMAKCSIISITNYDSYQSNDKQTTSKRQAGDKQTTTLEQGNNITIRDTSEADVIFSFWCDKMGKANTAKLTAGRKSKIMARIKEGYPVDQIKQAIENCSRSDFHMGQNDNGTKYNDLELICRSGAKLEFFRDMSGSMIDHNDWQGDVL